MGTTTESTGSTATPATAGKVTEIELTIGGMTCASCANRIERKLNKLDGVAATVNYATEKARSPLPRTWTPPRWSRRSRRPATPPRSRGTRPPTSPRTTTPTPTPVLKRPTRPGRCGTV